MLRATVVFAFFFFPFPSSADVFGTEALITVCCEGGVLLLPSWLLPISWKSQVHGNGQKC